jgi:hypothetical protein
VDAQTAPKKKLAPAGGMLNLQSRGEPPRLHTNPTNPLISIGADCRDDFVSCVISVDPFADADFGSGSSPSSAQAGAKANASRTGTPKIDDDLGGVAGGKIHIRQYLAGGEVDIAESNSGG